MLVIPDGVTLMSGRSPAVEGGILEMSHRMPPDPNDEEVYKRIMLNLGSNTRITGLRLRGYNPRDTTDRDDGTRAIHIRESTGVLIDNNEIFGWPEEGVNVAHGSVRVTRNFFHNNVQCNKGYGVNVSSGGHAQIDRNLFNYNRHDVAGSGGAGHGYTAELNFALTSGPKCGGTFKHYNQHFDMHGDGEDGYGGTAGTYMEIRRNTIRGAQSYYLGSKKRPGFMLRGTPERDAVFTDNAVHHGKPLGGKGAVRVKGPNPITLILSKKLVVKDNRMCVDTAHELAVGDFDGDGRDDVFQSVGTLWAYSPAGRREWHYLNASTLRLDRIGLGDFDDDGKTDVFFRDGDRWLVSYGGTAQPTPLPAESGIDIKHYRFGDFDDDGKTDVFRANGTRFVISSGGATEWQPLAASEAKLSELRFGDFDADGKTDVFRIGRNQWSVSDGANASWRRLNRKLSSDLGSLVFADFNNDRHTDVARSNGGKWQVSWSGTTEWRTLQASRSESISTGMLFGDFVGDGGADVLQHGVPLGAKVPLPCWAAKTRMHSFERFKLSQGGSQPLRSWSFADMR